eukprot:5340982-Pleurochrysis_carterae.AAC.1
MVTPRSKAGRLGGEIPWSEGFIERAQHFPSVGPCHYLCAAQFHAFAKCLHMGPWTNAAVLRLHAAPLSVFARSIRHRCAILRCVVCVRACERACVRACVCVV